MRGCISPFRDGKSAMTEILIISAINVGVCLTAIVLLVWMFSRWERRYERRIVETARETRSRMLAEKDRLRAEAEEAARGLSDEVMRSTGDRERTISEHTGRLEEFSRRLEDLRKYQDSVRLSLENALRDAEARWRKIFSGADETDESKLAQLKEKLPAFEENLADFAERCRELSDDFRGLIDQHKTLNEKSGGAKSPEEAADIIRRAGALLLDTGKSMDTAGEAFEEVETAVKDFLEFISSMYNICDLCGKAEMDLSVCLNCNKKYCEECKGLQIGHCKACAPSYRPLHIDISET